MAAHFSFSPALLSWLQTLFSMEALAFLKGEADETTVNRHKAKSTQEELFCDFPGKSHYIFTTKQDFFIVIVGLFYNRFIA